MIPALYALTGALITVAAALACGLIAFRALGVVLRAWEHQALAFVAGSAILSTLVLGLAALQLARKGVFLGLAVCLILAAGFCRRGGPAPSSWSVPRRWLVLLLTVTVPFAVLYLCTAWAPEVSPDGSTYHLGNVLRFWAHHGLIPIRDMYGAMPEGLEMLFLMAFSIGRHSAAALVHLAFLAALPLLLLCYSFRFGMPKAGLLAAALIFASPVIGKDGVSAYNDVALAAATFGAFYFVELWLEQKRPAFLILAGTLAGYCFAIKYTGFVAAVYVLSQIGMQAFRDRAWKWRPVLQFAVPCALLCTPWLVKNAVYMRNPVSPFFNRVFPNPYVTPQFETDYQRSMAHFAGDRNLRELAVGYTVRDAGVGGFFGPVFLLAPLGLMALRDPRGRRLLLAAAITALPALSNEGARFLIPAAPFAALALGMAVADTRFAVPALMALHAFFCWPPVAGAYSDRWAWRITQFPVRAIFDVNSATRYMQANLGGGWEMARFIDQHLQPEGRIYCFHCPTQAYHQAEFSCHYESLEARALMDMLWTPMESGRQPLKQVVLSFPQLLATRLRVMLAKTGPDQVWSVSEMRILQGGRDVPRSPRWKIRASPDPWEAPFAFDNSPVSRWSTEQYGATGAFLEVTFDQPTAVDSLMLECPADSPDWLELLADAPPHERIPVRAEIRTVAVKPPTGMRREAVRMLESYGFAYLIVSSDDWYSDDYKKYPSYWGIRTVAEMGGWTLYHLE